MEDQLEEIEQHHHHHQDLRVSPLQLSDISAAPPPRYSTVTVVDAPQIPATFRGDGYQVPPRRVDAASAPLSVADSAVNTSYFTTASSSSNKQHYDDTNHQSSQSPRVQRLQHLETLEGNGGSVEFPMLLGNASYSRVMMDPNKHNNNNNMMMSSQHQQPFFPHSYPKYGPSGTLPLLSSNPPAYHDDQHHHLPFNASSAYHHPQPPPTYNAWGSLPLVSQSPPSSRQPTSFLLPPSPYVNEGISFRPNPAASSAIPHQLLTPPTAHGQIHSLSNQSMECNRVGHSVPAPQCPVLSGHEPGGNHHIMQQQQQPQHSRSMSISNGYGHSYNPYNHPNNNGPTYLPTPPPSHPGMMPQFGVYPDYTQGDEGWNEAGGQPSGYGFYPLDPGYQYNGCTLVPLSPSYVSSMTNQMPMMNHGVEGQPLWNPSSSAAFHPYPSTYYTPSTNQRGVTPPQNRTGATPPLIDIESRVAPEHHHPARHRNETNTMNESGRVVGSSQYQQQHQRPPVAMRRTSADWGQAVPSQEKRHSKKWWMLCSSV